MTARLSSALLRLRVGEAIHFRPEFASASYPVPVARVFRDYSVCWANLRPEKAEEFDEPEALMPLAEWLLLAGMAAALAAAGAN